MLVGEWLRERRRDKHRRKILDLEAQLEARDRQIVILTAEVEGLSAVIARDRMRVASEIAVFALKKAEAEHDRRADPGA